MASTRLSRVRGVADWLGIFASGACALHCLLVPALLVAGLALPGPLASDEVFHEAVLRVIVPVSIVAFGIGCWRHKDRWVLGLAAVGVAGMVAAVTVLHDVAGENGERAATLLSAVCLIAAHYRNFRLCRSADNA
ncbi:MAG: MerC domain-containing protein [Pseudomonadota bacterium]